MASFAADHGGISGVKAGDAGQLRRVLQQAGIGDGETDGRQPRARAQRPARATPKRATKAAGVTTSIAPRGVAMAKAVRRSARRRPRRRKLRMKARCRAGSSATATTPAMPEALLACFWNAGFQKFSG